MTKTRKKAVQPTDSSYDRLMAEAIAEYKAWVNSRKRVSVKHILDYTLPKENTV
jgi:hypothetical protein